MDIGVIVNRIVRDMKLNGVIMQDKEGEAKFHVNLAVVAGYEYFRRTELNHNQRAIDMFSITGEKLKHFNSIAEASRQLKMARGTIDDCLYGKTKVVKERYYFRYADTL